MPQTREQRRAHSRRYHQEHRDEILARKRRYDDAHREVNREKARQRDSSRPKGVCCDCGAEIYYRTTRCGSCASGVGLNAHHLVSLAETVRRLVREWAPDLNTPADHHALAQRLIARPEVRDIDTGITLCVPCHDARHDFTLYRGGENTWH